jgi:hypothetical protein
LSQRLNSFFKTSQQLSQLSGKVRQIRALQLHYEQVTPPSLLRASQVIQIEHAVLTLAANNGATAAKLRQMAPELIKQLQLNGCEVTGIHVKVQVTLPAASPPQHIAVISPHAKQELNSLAGTLPDSPLKEALQRLIRRGK